MTGNGLLFPHRHDGTAARLLPRPASTEANFQYCSAKKRMSARADFIGTRYSICEATVCAENLQKSERDIFRESLARDDYG